MPYPAQINTIAHSCIWSPQILGPFVPPGGGNNRYVISAQNTNTAALRLLRAWKSTDKGLTWSEMDSGNHPAIHQATIGRNFCPIQDGNDIKVAYSAPGPLLALITFSMSTDTWGSPDVSTIVPERAHGFNDDGGDYRVMLCKRSTDSSLWMLFYYTVDVVGGNQKDRGWLVQHNGSWQTPFKAFGVAGEAVDYAPVGIVEGTSGRLHCFCTSCSTFGPSQTYKIYQRTLDASNNLQTLQTIVSDVWPIQEPHVSPAIVDGSGRAWIAFARKGSGAFPSFKWTPAVAYGTSANDPTWTEENISSTEIINLGNLNYAHIGSIHSTVFGVWREPGAVFKYSSNANLAGWSTPVNWGDSDNAEDYSSVRGLTGIGLGFLAYPFSNNPPLWYTEVEVQVDEPVIVEPLDTGCLYFSA